LRSVMGMQVWDLEIPVSSVSSEVNKIYSNLTEDDINMDDYVDAIEGLAGVGAATGLPTEQILQMSKGVGDLLQGNVRNGIGQLLGWSEYALGGAEEKEKIFE